MIQVVRRSIVDIYNLYSFSRGSLAYDSKGKLYHLHNARFEAGKFGQAVMVEEGTTNLCANGSFEVDVSGWTFPSGLYERTSTEKYFGAYSLKLTNPNTSTAGQAWYSMSSPSSYAGTTATVSVWAKASVSNRVQINVREYDGSTYKWTNSSFHSGNAQWQRLSATLTFRSTVTDIQIQLVVHAGDPATSAYFDGVQFEQKPYATSFTDSTRSPETLTIPTAGVLNPQEGAIDLWIYVNDYLKTNYGSTKQMFYWSTATGRISLGWNIDGYWYAVVGNGISNSTASISDTLSVGRHFFSMRWNAAEMALLIDGGAQKATVANPYLPSSVSGSANIGYVSGGGCVNSLIDDLRISSRARTDAEIAAAYASGEPLAVDADTTLKLDFDGPDAQRAAKVLVA